MNVFRLHGQVIEDYSAYTRSFIRIADERVRTSVEDQIRDGLLWPDPLIQLNPSFAPGGTIDDVVSQGVLHDECSRVFRIKAHDNDLGKPLRLHQHQKEAIGVAASGRPYVVTTGTGSGKSLCYLIPIVDYVLKHGSGRGLKAIVVYPMNALANSQLEELHKFLSRGYPEGQPPVTFKRYTGQEDSSEREAILKNPPDIILTNYVMLELILTRVEEQALVSRAGDLRFLVLDELHTYRGRQGADVAMLVRRCREAFSGDRMLCIGTSATMSTEGDSRAQASAVASVASDIFGQTVSVENVITETLVRATREFVATNAEDIAVLCERIEDPTTIPVDYGALKSDPLAAWVEATFGLRTEASTGRLVRQTPRALRGPQGASQQLATIAHCTPDRARAAIERVLLNGSNARQVGAPYPLFAFRLHQFITRGDTVWTTLELEDKRYLTLRAQQFQPGDREKRLFPLVFCRHCGQAYYRVNRLSLPGGIEMQPREGFERSNDEGVVSGYLYLSAESPWPSDTTQVLDRVPDTWVETRPDGSKRLRRGQPDPEILHVSAEGKLDDAGLEVAFVETPFRFCLNPKCKVAYGSRQRSDAGKLATIGVDGRSTATSVLALSAILYLRGDGDLPEEARKLLSFTDNRQDASLQAGHFNDFAEIGLIRSGLLRAMRKAGSEGLRHEVLTQQVEAAMNLDFQYFAAEPESLRGAALHETKRAFRAVLGYYLYRDQQRGWRVTSPNLEECGLLHVEYLGARELADDAKFWQEADVHSTLKQASNAQRMSIATALLDHLRRNLALKEDSLTRDRQDQIRELSSQRLCDPWVLEQYEQLEQSCIAWPRSGSDGDDSWDLFVSPMSSFGQYLKRPNILPDIGHALSQVEVSKIIADLFMALKQWGLVVEVRSPRNGTTVPGYQLPSSAMVWRAGDGSKPMVDPLRIVQASGIEREANRFFVEFYCRFVDCGGGLEAREHTAQVPSDIREDREESFRRAELPILFCSPTMELGVDIAQLNVVNMRNVPPTPANYAQRSGRAGRSGQPAFVYTYCSGFSPHDRYYFNRPAQMVCGAVSPPRIDLTNRDLVQSHVRAVWLAAAELKLGQTLADVLVVSESDRRLPIRDDIRDKLASGQVGQKALQRARRVIDAIGDGIREASWYRDGWLDDVIARIPQDFDAACERWRTLYRAAVQQRLRNNAIIGDHSRSEDDRNRAKRLRAQAEAQIQLLTSAQSAMEGDFYSYRYFASEGFLPGYNFPRLPLSAFIPARRGRRGKSEFVSRPRFLAISEFGPRAVIYHEGSRYRINKVNIAFEDGDSEISKASMKVCAHCGYGHEVLEEPGPNVCEHCREPLFATSQIRDMVRLSNVTAKRADRITSDEEERQRIGYELRTTFRFGDTDGHADVCTAEAQLNGGRLALLSYGDAATIWRVNVGWLRRAIPSQHGFLLDAERGYWATNQDIEDHDEADPLSAKVMRVVPYVEDRRNALVLQFPVQHNEQTLATLQAALKEAIQFVYQLESGELAADPLPSRSDRRLIFMYESAEGGAGVLRQLATDPRAFPTIAREALRLCHFDPDTGEDLGAQAGNGEGCEAACYDCLLDYGNQMDHRLLDRKLILPILRELASSTVVPGVGRFSRPEQIQKLHASCDSELERRWLRYVDEKRLTVPTDGQYLIESCTTRPDFYYADTKAAVYVDGPPHDEPQQQLKDQEINDRLMDAGYLVIRFHHTADWPTIFARYPDVFGVKDA